MVEVLNLNKTVEKFRLKNISFLFPTGYILGVTGENGAGKTTLLNTILGLYKDYSGCIKIDNRNIMLQEKEVKEDIGFVFTEEIFSFELSLEENARLYGKYYHNYDAKIFYDYLEQFHLSPTQKYKTLSKGEKMKFAFAFALSHNPKLLILDEPTANFDPDFKKDFKRILSQFVSNGDKSVIIATHDLEELDDFIDYLLVLQEGEQRIFDTLEHIKDRFRLVEGEENALSFLKKERLIYKEQGEFSTKALIMHVETAYYDKNLVVKKPTLEEFLYFYFKGGARPC